MAAMRPCATQRSETKAGEPVPSTMRAPVKTRSSATRVDEAAERPRRKNAAAERAAAFRLKTLLKTGPRTPLAAGLPFGEVES
jgi:hypothetical protein